MSAHYDMTTGEWIDDEQAETATRADARYLPPAPTPGLVQVHEHVDIIPRKWGLPADIATLPISVMLAKLAGHRKDQLDTPRNDLQVEALQGSPYTGPA